MERPSDDFAFSQRRAVRPLKVIIVGAGIGGLAVGLCMRKTGHNVYILEQKREITEVGAGIQLAPNAARVLRRFGVLDEAMKYATVLQRNSLRRWKNDEELGLVPLVPRIEEQFGAPLAVIHRADLLRVLLEAAKESGCKILTDHKVVGTDPHFQPWLTLLDRRILVRNNDIDRWVSGDLVIAADGMNSLVRRQIALACGHDDRLVPTGETAYRFMLSKESIQHDETVMALLRENQAVRWYVLKPPMPVVRPKSLWSSGANQYRNMGPGGHIMAYPLRQNTLYNVVLTGPLDANEPQKTSWTSHGRKEEVFEHYREWCPVVRALIKYVPDSEVLETAMNDLPPLPTWVKGQIVLAGDACHYMPPYVAQGAANAIEDAGTLAMAFTCTDDIELALEVYQLLRKGRSERIQASATKTGHNLHMPDGEEQRKRDDAIRAGSRGEGANPDQWNDREWNKFMWGVDVMAEAIKNWESLTQTADLARERTI
ncbi:putative salicylate hydroxylase [Xylariaceae sp. FL1651]|nr:putative salicylate hydroxylase [Xylariaceae sp. FL1651]